MQWLCVDVAATLSLVLQEEFIGNLDDKQIFGWMDGWITSRWTESWIDGQKDDLWFFLPGFLSSASMRDRAEKNATIK